MVSVNLPSLLVGPEEMGRLAVGEVLVASTDLPNDLHEPMPRDNLDRHVSAIKDACAKAEVRVVFCKARPW